jgi:hypothetical protein
MKKKANVVMLPSKEKAVINLNLYRDENKLQHSDEIEKYSTNPVELILDRGYVPQHLYLITDGDIEEGDWVYHTELNFIAQVKDLDRENDYSKYWNLAREGHADGSYAEVKFKLVRISTDNKLIYVGGNTLPFGDTAIAKFSEGFIRRYVKAGGIDEVNVDFNHFQDLDTKEEVWALNLREDRTAIITEIKTSYTREEVVKLFNGFYNYSMDEHDGFLREYAIDEWIEKNL